jgi:hypothetical protein
MEISPIIVVVWMELTLIALGALVFLLLSGMSKKKKRLKATKALFKAIKAGRDKRKEELTGSLLAYGLSEKQIARRVRDIDHQELNLYQHVGMLFSEGDENLLKTLTVAHEATLAPLLALDLSAEGNAGGGSSVSEQELEALKEANARLENELSVTMDTVGRMLSEYSSMFGSEEAEGLDKEKIMQSFDSEVDEEPDDFAGIDELDTTTDDIAGDDIPEDDTEDDMDVGDVPDDELLEIGDDWGDEAEDAASESLVEPEPEPETETAAETESAPDAAAEDHDVIIESLDDTEVAAEDVDFGISEPDLEIPEQPVIDEEDLDISADELDQLAAEVAAIEIEDSSPETETVESKPGSAQDDMLNDLDIDSLLDQQAAAKRSGEAGVADTTNITGMVDIDTDLDGSDDKAANEEEEDDFSDVEIEDMDDIDIDALLNSHMEENEKH